MARRFDRKGYQRDMGRCTGVRKYSNGRVGRCDHPSHGCFPGYTPVLTPSGFRQIDEILAGDRVVAYSVQHNNLRPSVVRRKISYGIQQVLKIEFDDATKTPLCVTASHSLLSDQNSWVTAGQLRVGDRLSFLGAGRMSAVQIVSIMPAGQSSVFNLVVDNEFTFIVGGGVPAHSFTYARTFRTALHKFWSGISPRGGRNFSPVLRPNGSEATASFI